MVKDIANPKSPPTFEDYFVKYFFNEGDLNRYYAVNLFRFLVSLDAGPRFPFRWIDSCNKGLDAVCAILEIKEKEKERDLDIVYFLKALKWFCRFKKSDTFLSKIYYLKIIYFFNKIKNQNPIHNIFLLVLDHEFKTLDQNQKMVCFGSIVGMQNIPDGMCALAASLVFVHLEGQSDKTDKRSISVKKSWNTFIENYLQDFYALEDPYTHNVVKKIRDHTKNISWIKSC